jgi:hypothetical protein
MHHGVLMILRSARRLIGATDANLYIKTVHTNRDAAKGKNNEISDICKILEKRRHVRFHAPPAAPLLHQGEFQPQPPKYIGKPQHRIYRTVDQ